MGAFDIGKIDDVIHGRMRLGIMAYLADAEVADFSELKKVLDATQGNLSDHLRKLEDAGFISIEKSFLNRKPLTLVCNAVADDQSDRLPVKWAQNALGRDFDFLVPEDRKAMDAAINEGVPLPIRGPGVKLDIPSLSG